MVVRVRPANVAELADGELRSLFFCLAARLTVARRSDRSCIANESELSCSHAPTPGGKVRHLKRAENDADDDVLDHDDATATVRQFHFADACGPQTSQADVYARTARPLLNQFLEGFN